MKDKLIKVQQALCMIEVKGTNTLIMADSLRLLEQCIQELAKEELAKESEKATESVEG